MTRVAWCMAAVLLVVGAAGAARGETPAERALRTYVPPPAPRADDWPRYRLVAFMRDLVDFVYKHHVVTDPARKTYGMAYEFYAGGKPMQEFGLDSMHDGAWLMSAMATAHRADPEGKYLDRVQRYQAPFYANMMSRSDRLFPDMKRTDEDKKPFLKPVKGWVPRGWDDGGGFKKSGQPFYEGYHPSSNHLAQDLANPTMNLWMTTRDSALARAVMDLREYKVEYFGPISVIETAAGIMNARPDLYETYKPSAFTVHSLDPCHSGLCRQNAAGIPAYDDDLAWEYRAATARYLVDGRMPPETVLRSAARVYASALAMELYFDSAPYPYGMYFFDIQGPPKFVQGAGRLDEYLSNSKKLFGARGIQFAWVGAGVLPYLAKHPGLWEQPYREKHADEPLVRIVDAPPDTDGRKDAAYAASQPLATGTTTVTLLADPMNLHVFIESDRPEATLEIRPADPVAGETPVGRFTVTRQKSARAVNGRGEPLVHRAAFRGGDAWTAELRVPFAVVPGQAHFINGLDHARYEVVVDGGPKRTVYMLSDPARIVARIEAIALGTIATWHEVWRKMGVIPSGYQMMEDRRVRAWELSDLGNYAHLVHTIALWLIYREGTSEWEIIRRDFPGKPQPGPPLPESVLKAQGLK